MCKIATAYIFVKHWPCCPLNHLSIIRNCYSLHSVKCWPYFPQKNLSITRNLHSTGVALERAPWVPVNTWISKIYSKKPFYYVKLPELTFLWNVNQIVLKNPCIYGISTAYIFVKKCVQIVLKITFLLCKIARAYIFVKC